MRHTLLFLLSFAACAGEAPEEAALCASVCDRVVTTCQSDAFPAVSDCEQGCRHDAEQGLDLVGLETCVDEAACDPFSMVECARAYDPAW